ncbi:MAG TPA: M24 family metallopeptidase [Stellaceae bacterium]|nr:M24 family metallopeptidase [Stellaceae bacterium]
MMDDALVPTFSRAERDRRWGLVRRRMMDERLDCLVGFPNGGRFEQLQANTRYLTQMGGFACEIGVAFPADGDVTAFVQSPRDIAWWSRAQDWIGDLRNCRRLWSDGMIARLKELKLERGRIGVIGLKGLIRAPEGVVPWLMFERLREAFPNAEFVSATEIVLETRAVKSAEEIGFIREAERLAELAVESMLAIAREGVAENVLYAELVKTMIANGGELPTMIYWGAGPRPTSEHLVPSRRKLARGDVLSNEIEAKYGGYIAQVAAPAVVGPIPPDHHASFEAARRIFDRLCSLIRPGVQLADIGRAYQGMVEEAGFKPMSWPFHGRGLGDDVPVMANASLASDAVFAEGHVMILKPGVVPRNGAEDAGERAGDTVLVTADGCRRLGQRPLGIAELPLR